MKKFCITLLVLFCTLSLQAKAENLDNLWKQVEATLHDDLPKSRINVLNKIIATAEKQEAYGHLIKAQLMKIKAETEISRDTLKPELARLEALTKKWQERCTRLADKGASAQQELNKAQALTAVYHCVLGCTYRSNDDYDDSYVELSLRHFDQALNHPEVLAATKTSGYVPLIAEEPDSRIFNHDLLHVIGLTAYRYETLLDYYSTHNSPAAACYCAVMVAEQKYQHNRTVAAHDEYVATLKNLLTQYAQIPEAGYAAIALYMTQLNGMTEKEQMSFIDDALTRWGTLPAMSDLKTRREILTQPTFTAELPSNVVLPNRQQTVELTGVRNLKEIRLKIIPLQISQPFKDPALRRKLQNCEIDPNEEKDYKLLKPLLASQPIQDLTRRLEGHEVYETYADSMLLQGLSRGVYLVEATTDNKAIAAQRQLLYVSDLYAVCEALPDQNLRIVALSATTGRPVPHAHLMVSHNYNRQGEKSYSLTCDAQGEAMLHYKDKDPDNILVGTDDDLWAINTAPYTYFNYNKNQQRQTEIRLFTDRSIYRPGQTVQISALVNEWLDNKDTHAKQGATLELILRNVNNQEVGTKRVTTDEYGLASTSFVLPQNGLTGAYNIIARGDVSASEYIMVEEYKRPTFEVEIDKYKESYAGGDTITLRGTTRSYAGVAVQGAEVSYTVNRKTPWWFFSADREDLLLSSGKTTTDDNGVFTIKVPLTMSAEMMQDQGKSKRRFFNFVTAVTVTDQAGETHEASLSLPLSNVPTDLSCTVPELIMRDSLTHIRFDYRNAAGENIPGKVTYWIDGKKYTAKANEDIRIDRAQLPSKNHTLRAICGQDTLLQHFATFTLNDRKPVITTHDWWYQSDSRFPANSAPVYVQMGSSDPNQHIVYTILAGDRVLENGVIDQSNAITTRKFTYKEEYGNGITLTCAWVREGKLYRHVAKIERPVKNRTLIAEWTTFRDMLTPGQQEEWRLKIKHPDGRQATAQLMATLYDKSLDDIEKHNWYFNINDWLPMAQTLWSGQDCYNLSLSGSIAIDYRQTVNPVFSTIAHGIIPERGQKLFCIIPASRPMATNANTKLAGRIAGITMSKKANNLADTETELSAVAASSEDGSAGQTGQLRQNLQETAFFYPALMTDERGEVSIRFTLPESVTSWRFMGLAHDKDMHWALIDATTVAKKVVMIQPNMPRFLREGDQAVISARIMNTSENSVSGTARLQLLDAATEQPVITLEQTFRMEAGKTGTATFNIDDTKLKSGLYICRITASGDGYSDGEQHYLPVLSGVEHLINTLPVTMTEAGQKAIDVASLFPQSSKDRRLTVELTNNPTWLMIQSLPTVAVNSDANAISQATAFYANTLGRHILNQSPDIRKMIELWQHEATLANNDKSQVNTQSPLQTNQELKDLVLDETPWLADATHESEQKQQLAGFFDKSALAYRLQMNLNKLRELQNPDGSFSWWKGMTGSTYMTQMVNKILVRLNALAGNQSATDKIITKAFAFMDKEIAKEVEELKKMKKKGVKNLMPSDLAYDYLYTSALAHRTETADMTYLLNLIEKKSAALTIYGKANTAVILAMYGRQAKANLHLKSLQEYSVYKEDMGRYFDTPKAYYSWHDYRIPTQVAAIEAMKALTPADTKTIEDMQRWLLQEKRTQCWDTPINTVDAVYAFLGGNTTSLTNGAAAPATITVDGKQVELPQATAGLGYVKTVLPNDNWQHMLIEKSSEGTSWGALYAQFTQTATEASDAAAGIKVSRQLFLMNGDKGTLLAPGAELKVGDKVKVRITIEAERDYDFVQVQDKRAACMEPADQKSGYHWGYYVAPKDNVTNYYFDRLAKGKQQVETTYYVDRAGTYQTGICTAQCAYAPEFSGRAKASNIHVK